MTNTTATPVRVLLDDAISEYISDTGDAPHYRVHLLDLLESTLQADPQDTDLVRTPGTVEISREAATHIGHFMRDASHFDPQFDQWVLVELDAALAQENTNG